MFTVDTSVGYVREEGDSRGGAGRGVQIDRRYLHALEGLKGHKIRRVCVNMKDYKQIVRMDRIV